jgi:hypothetical protein
MRLALFKERNRVDVSYSPEDKNYSVSETLCSLSFLEVRPMDDAHTSSDSEVSKMFLSVRNFFCRKDYMINSKFLCLRLLYVL